MCYILETSEQLQEKLKWYEEQFRLFQHKRFGASSEKYPEQMELFNEAESILDALPQDEGELEGFDIESGDGWVLYSNKFPDGRRRGLERIRSRRNTTLGPVLSFSGQGTTVFDYDKTVIVVGEDVADTVRTALAVPVLEWQQHGGDPTLIVLGDSRPFEIVGCRDIFQPPEQTESIIQAEWLRTILRQVRPWIDVIIVLDAPEWATQVLTEACASKGLWSPWIVTSSYQDHLKANLVLEADIAGTLLDAHHQAQILRPHL